MSEPGRTLGRLRTSAHHDVLRTDNVQLALAAILKTLTGTFFKFLFKIILLVSHGGRIPEFLCAHNGCVEEKVRMTPRELLGEKSLLI